jgi:hypothetical protein
MSQYRFVHHKSHRDWYRIELKPLRSEAGRYPLEPWRDWYDYLWNQIIERIINERGLMNEVLKR